MSYQLYRTLLEEYRHRAKRESWGKEFIHGFPDSPAGRESFTQVIEMAFSRDEEDAINRYNKTRNSHDCLWRESGGKTIFVPKVLSDWLKTVEVDVTFAELPSVLWPCVSLSFEDSSITPLLCVKGDEGVGWMVSSIKEREWHVKVTRIPSELSSGGEVGAFGTGGVTRQLHSQMQIFYRVLCYIGAFPDSLQRGCPSSVMNSRKDDTYVLNVHNTAKLHMTDVRTHLRRSHFRCLRDERFKRDDAGNPRIVLVRATIVKSGGIDPYTVSTQHG